MSFAPEIALATAAVAEAADFCRAVSDSAGTALTKSDRSPVTVADYGSQAIVCRHIGERFPADAILAEEHSAALLESENAATAARLRELLAGHPGWDLPLETIRGWIDYTPAGSNGRTWILDPIDGTKGFLRGEQYAIALALMVDGEIKLGVLGCPNLAYDESRIGCMFMAERGQGARQHWLGDTSVARPIHVSADADGGNMTFVESVESAHADHAQHEVLSKHLGISRPAVRLDSQAKYGVVARGEASAYLRLQPDPKYRQKVWDHAAGVIIVEEAGGRVCDGEGRDLDFTLGPTLAGNLGVVVTNGACHDRLMAAIFAHG